MSEEMAESEASGQSAGPLHPEDPRHGTVNGYNNLGCRCADCKTAWTEFCKRRRQERRERLPENTTVLHGSESTYFNHSCRCALCKDAHTEGERLRRTRRLARKDNR